MNKVDNRVSQSNGEDWQSPVSDDVYKMTLISGEQKGEGIKRRLLNESEQILTPRCWPQMEVGSVT